VKFLEGIENIELKPKVIFAISILDLIGLMVYCKWRDELSISAVNLLEMHHIS